MITTHNRILAALINAGIKIKGVQGSKDGVFIAFSDDGKKYRLFVAEEKPMPAKLVKETEIFNTEY